MKHRDTPKARELRLHSTEAEKLVWSKIRNRQFSNLKFKRQYPIPPYIVDFCCIEEKLIIELDGGQHTPEKDAIRTKFLETQGYRVLRFWNNDVLQNIEGVMANIKESTPHPNPLPQGEREQGRRVLIGRIATAHGVRGDVKVQYFLEDTDFLFNKNGVYTSETKPERIVLTYKNDLNGKVVVCSVKGLTDRNVAERLRGTSLYLDESDLPALDADAVYLRELEGMEAVTPEGKALGTVLGVRNFGASDLLEIRGKKETYFIPFCEPFLVGVDKDVRRVTLIEPEVL